MLGWPANATAAPAAVAPSWSERVADLADSAAAVTGWPLLRPVTVEALSLEEFRLRAAEMLDAQTPPDRRAEVARVLQRLGLLPPGGDLGALQLDLVAAAAAAFYDSETERLCILPQGEASAEFELVLAHELAHALQDQHHDLDRLLGLAAPADTLSGDARAAGHFLVEGHATWVMLRLGAPGPRAAAAADAAAGMLGMLADLPLDALLGQAARLGLAGGADPAGVVALAEAPAVLSQPLLLAYLAGAGFAARARQRYGAGWQDSLFARAPAATAHVLHPERHFAREPVVRFPLPPASRLLPGARVRHADTAGALLVRIFFQQHGRGAAARDLAAGWAGDLLVALEAPRGPLALLWWSAWRGEGEAAAFADAYEQALVRRLGVVRLARGSYGRPGSGLRWQVARDGAVVHVIEGAAAADLPRLRRAMAAAEPR